MQNSLSKFKLPLLWAAVGFLLVLLIVTRIFFPETLWLTALISGSLIGLFTWMIKENWNKLRTRSMAFGINSFVSVLLVTMILGVLNFLTKSYPIKIDLTKNKLNTLSNHSVNAVKGMKTPVQFTVFAKSAASEQHKPLLQRYDDLSPRLSVEFVNPDLDIIRTKELGITKDNTLHIQSGDKTTLVTELNEEKITNALIKLVKNKKQVVCGVTGHNEGDFKSREANGFEVARTGFEDHAYQFKEINLMESGKVPDDCNIISVVGPSSAFFEREVDVLDKYLAEGGRALFALDIQIKGREYLSELGKLLEKWYVRPARALILDPVSRAFRLSEAVPTSDDFSKDHKITKDFSRLSKIVFPFSRPLEIVAGAPVTMKVHWLAKTRPSSWGEIDFASLSKGAKADGADKKGPLNIALAIEGKSKASKAKDPTRIIVFGSSAFANNNFARYGQNFDLFMNSVSWLMEDDSLISIRKKEADAGVLALTPQAGLMIFWFSMVIFPALSIVAGVAVWWRRRRL